MNDLYDSYREKRTLVDISVGAKKKKNRRKTTLKNSIGSCDQYERKWKRGEREGAKVKIIEVRLHGKMVWKLVCFWFHIPCSKLHILWILHTRSECKCRTTDFSIKFCRVLSMGCGYGNVCFEMNFDFRKPGRVCFLESDFPFVEICQQ